MAHLHEHRAAVNRLVSIVDTTLFASSSADGCIKIWDASKMEGRNIANRSRYISVELFYNINILFLQIFKTINVQFNVILIFLNISAKSF